MTNIYLITNTLTKPNKSYVGRTIGIIEDRLNQHARGKTLNGDRILYQDLKYYGMMNFKITLLENVENGDGRKEEAAWIRKLNTHYKDGYGYNMRYEDFTDLPPIYKRLQIDEKTKQKILENINNGSVWNKGIKILPEIAEKMMKTKADRRSKGLYVNYGHKQSDETKKIISGIKKEQYRNGFKNPNTEKWKVTFENGNSFIIDHLSKWCEQEQYNYRTVRGMKYRNKVNPYNFIVEKVV